MVTARLVGGHVLEGGALPRGHEEVAEVTDRGDRLDIHYVGREANRPNHEGGEVTERHRMVRCRKQFDLGSIRFDFKWVMEAEVTF